MIDLPKTLTESLLQSKLIRGSVLRTRFEFQSSTQFKRLIVLNNGPVIDQVYFVYTTSQIDFYTRNKDIDIIKLHTVFLKRGEIILNPDKDMVIDCRNVRQISKEKLIEYLNKKELDFLGCIPTCVMNKIDTILAKSNLVAPKILKYILPTKTKADQ